MNITENLTADKIALALVVIVYLYGAFKAIAAKTATKADDEIIDKIERAKGWAATIAPHLWAIVEALAAQGVIKSDGEVRKGQAKLDEFMRRLEAEHAKMNGGALPAEAASVGATIASGISAADTLSRPPAGPAGR